MYIDIEATGNINEIENMVPVAVTMADDSTKKPDVMFNPIVVGTYIWDSVYMHLDRSDEAIYTFNGCKFDFRLMANRPYFSDKIEWIKEVALNSIDIHLNICVVYTKMVSLSSLWIGSVRGWGKQSGSVIQTLLNTRNYTEIKTYCKNECDLFYNVMSHWQETSQFVSWGYGATKRLEVFTIPKLMTVKECIEADTTRRWVEKYDWLIN